MSGSSNCPDFGFLYSKYKLRETRLNLLKKVGKKEKN
jgi:hypothetical protein